MMAVVFDHLWQSTLFACAAGLLALALRRHSARARYWAWFAASLKFLIPFALLESAGSWLASRWPTPGGGAPGLYQPVIDALGRVSTPFLATTATAIGATSSPIAPVHTGFALQMPEITIALAGAWLAGTTVVVAIWAVRWLRLLAVVRAATTVDVAAPVPVKATSSRVEPGLACVFRPILLLPEGLSQHLSPQEIRSLIAHEVSHLHRRDNLTAAIHMLVEAVFWFYPLTWWLGTRLIAERERACDESVLASGHDPEIYAEGILKVCRFYIQAPLACTAGVSGADLKKRIEVIMSSPAVRRMSVATRLALVLAGIAGLCAPVLYGLISAPAAAAPVTAQMSTPPPAASSSATPAETERNEYEQTRPQKEVPFNPADFDKYAGYYQFDNAGLSAHVYRTGSRYYLQITGQPAVEFFPESATEFFTTVVAAQMSFTVGADGAVTRMVIHQNGALIPLHRVSQAGYNATNEELQERVKADTPSPGTRAMVLAYINDLEQGRPQNYDTMSPELAAAARRQAPKALQAVHQVGAFESLTFAKVAPNGFDVYIATFANGKLLWVISPLSKDGKVTGLFFRPYPP